MGLNSLDAPVRAAYDRAVAALEDLRTQCDRAYAVMTTLQLEPGKKGGEIDHHVFALMTLWFNRV